MKVYTEVFTKAAAQDNYHNNFYKDFSFNFDYYLKQFALRLRKNSTLCAYISSKSTIKGIRRDFEAVGLVYVVLILNRYLFSE